MRSDRRSIIAVIWFVAIPLPAFAQKTPISPWVELAKVLGDIGESLYTFSEAVDKITVVAVNRYDWLKGRSAKEVLTGTSMQLSELLADQVSVQQALDLYGDRWRKLHRRGHKMTGPEQRQLERTWSAAMVTLRKIAARTDRVLSNMSGMKEVALDEAYIDLRSALRSKVGVIEQIARERAPANPGELDDLVAQEELFLQLRSNARSALQSVNKAIKRLGA